MASARNRLDEITHNPYEGTDQAGHYARLLLLDYSNVFGLVNYVIPINKFLNTGIHAILPEDWPPVCVIPNQG